MSREKNYLLNRHNLTTQFNCHLYFLHVYALLWKVLKKEIKNLPINEIYENQMTLKNI